MWFLSDSVGVNHRALTGLCGNCTFELIKRKLAILLVIWGDKSIKLMADMIRCYSKSTLEVVTSSSFCN